MKNQIVKKLLGYRSMDYADSILESPDILNYFFGPADAFWEHDDNSENPHAELTSGKCSNAFFDCIRILCYPNICEILAHQLAKNIRHELTVNGSRIDWVVSSSYAAITFGHELAKALCAKFGFTEKDPTDAKKQIWQRMVIPKDSVVLQAEELITTSQTFKEVRRAIEEGNPEPVEFLPIVGTLVHRPPELPAYYGDAKIIALIEKEVWAVDQSECYLCKAGSKRFRPKTHWKELTGKT